MKTQLRFLLIGAALILALACITCRGGDQMLEEAIGTEALMTGLTIGKVRIPVIPEPVDSFNFEGEGYDVSNMALEIAPLERSSDTESTRLKPKVSRGAKVKYGIGTEDQIPFIFSDVRVLANFDDGDYLYFQVTAEDGSNANYYRFNVWVQSPVIDLEEVYIGDVVTHEEENDKGDMVTIVDEDNRMMATLATPSSDLKAAMLASSGLLDIMSSQSANAEIKVTPAYSNVSLRYALTSKNDEKPVFGTSNKFNLADQKNLFIEVTAENKVDVAYYRFKVNVGRIATIKSLTFIGTGDVEFAIASKGNPGSAYGAALPGSFETAEMPVDGFKIKFELTDPDAKECTYILHPKTSTATPQFPVLGSPPPVKVVFNGANRLVLRVISENMQNVQYYKIDVNLLAAIFTKQPKSEYYYYYDDDTWVGPGKDENNVVHPKINWYTYAAKNFMESDGTTPIPQATIKSEILPKMKTVQPLTFELDRSGSFTYQWYEANSWYGGYGFDADGKILYYYDADKDAIPEDGFVGGDANDPSTYYVKGFDEKKNVSFHNGGNQFYRLPVKGRLITGATSATYTPDINKRPFIDGFTSETHYYWVEITDNSFTPPRKVVSKRAAIVSERHPRKKHHIVNMYAYEGHPYGDLYLKGNTDNPDEITETGAARNPNVFTYQRETYEIPVTFPADFNINDYTVSTVQALFWLIDGTPWIQNWTQGDIGFGKNKGTDRVMYYNLTNNNGTLGLVGGGKEPGGGTVDFKPKYIVVKPAGEKPVKQLPPLDANNKPIPNNNAQGWFTGFIELVEVRFEGPAR